MFQIGIPRIWIFPDKIVFLRQPQDLFGFLTQVAAQHGSHKQRCDDERDLEPHQYVLKQRRPYPFRHPVAHETQGYVYDEPAEEVQPAKQGDTSRRGIDGFKKH